MNIQGSFDLLNNSFYIEDNKFLIRERKKELEKKTSKYLSIIKPSFKYISSLFPNGDNQFKFDYEEDLYSLFIDEKLKKVRIERE